MNMKSRTTLAVLALFAAAPNCLFAQNDLSVFDTSRLTPAVDTFSMVLQGNPVGTLVTNFSISDGVASSASEVEITVQGFTQLMTADARFSVDDLLMISNDQTIDFGGFQAQTAIRYDNGHVTGQGQNPSPTGVATTEVDTVIGTDIIDSGALFPLLGTVDWSDGQSLSLETFQATQGTTTTTTVTASSETVIVPAGTFNTWKLDIRGIVQPLSIWLTKDGGRMVKMVPVGQPLEIVLGQAPPPAPED